MSSTSLLGSFWSHVFTNPDGKAVVLKNPFANSPPIVVAGGPPMGTGAHVIFPPALAHVTWESAGQAVATIMAYLRQNGFQKGDRAAILGWNSPEWVWADLAIQSLGGVTIPIYPHSAAEQVNYVLTDSAAKFTFSNEDEQLKKVSTGKAVHFDQIPHELASWLPVRPFFKWFVANSSPELADNPLSWPGISQELERLQSGFDKQGFCGITASDLATIIYTSGSTGVPKGGMLTHGNIAAACQGLTAHGFKQDPENDLYLSFLPLAHVYERVDGMAMSIWNGVPVAFCKVDEVGAALKLYEPTMMLGVPAVWRKIKDNIEAKLKEATGLKKSIADWAFAQKQAGLKRFVADLLVFSKIRSELGGRLRILLSGGAPISPDVLEFFNLLGLELLQGYGLTETAGGITTNRPSWMHKVEGPRNKVGSVGQLVASCEVKIVPEPGDSSDQGEILLRGPLVFKGYWNMPEENAKTFTPDGWFKTGDLGRVDEDGFLFITGRKKRLLKTEGGKYVAPEKIEKAFEPYPIVQYAVPVGDGRKYVSALIFVNLAVAEKLVSRPVPAGVDRVLFLASQDEVKKAVAEAVGAVNGKLERWETLKKFSIITQEASVANGLLTPTLKIRSEEVGKRFKTEIESLYQ